MIVKARRNLFICSDDPFEDVFINPYHIVSVERNVGEHEGKTIIRVPGEVSYICKSTFKELMQLLKEEG